MPLAGTGEPRVPRASRSRVAVFARAGAIVAALAILVVAIRPRDRHPPFFPQFRRDVSDKLAAAALFATRLDPRGQSLVVQPSAKPKPATPPSVAVYADAVAAKLDHPGKKAFRADTDLFCDMNAREVEAKARKEGVTIAEIRELTYFGFAAMRATQPELIEGEIGRQLTDDERKLLSDILQEENKSFTQALHQAVDSGASEAQRWNLIQTYEQYFADRLAQAFGITDGQFDHMLSPAPDSRVAGRVIAPPPPDMVPPPAPTDPAAAPPPGAPPTPNGKLTPASPPPASPAGAQIGGAAPPAPQPGGRP